MNEPQSVEECVYYTRRAIGDGYVTMWVLRGSCPKCGKGVMGKPRDPTGKVKIRAKDYVCPACGYTVEKEAYEESLTAHVRYTCSCKHQGEQSVPFKRKKVKGVTLLRVLCEKCKAPIDITKKME